METRASGRPSDLQRDDEYVAIRRGIEARLRRVCADWNECEFQALVDRIADTTQKYALRNRSGKQADD